MKRRWIWRNGQLVEVGPAVRARQQAPSVIGDTADPFRSHADGIIYDSKSAYRRQLKRHGMVELGNDRLPNAKPEPQDAERDLNTAWNNLGY